ncbi:MULTISPECIES: DUF3558 domain-containing protein [Prauserella]|uniref:DUF3558 domain-containing protein n=1 Tax=Prauserella TaxID=142577 RepID=UPI0013053482|nr:MULTISPECIES: DUF3558 domain-containing protein [Prauserella]
MSVRCATPSWRCLALVGAATLGLLPIAACSNPEPGEARPADSSTSTPTETASTPDSAIPAIDQPLDISYLRAAPCEALTPEQVEEFFGEGNVATPDLEASAGPECAWRKGTSVSGIHVALPDATNTGLRALYANRDAYEYFEELPPANGYPAVAYQLDDNRAGGDCTVRVGTSDETSVNVNVLLGEDKVGQVDPCEAAYEVTTAVIGNIKARN